MLSNARTLRNPNKVVVVDDDDDDDDDNDDDDDDDDDDVRLFSAYFLIFYTIYEKIRM